MHLLQPPSEAFSVSDRHRHRHRHRQSQFYDPPLSSSNITRLHSNRKLMATVAASARLQIGTPCVLPAAKKSLSVAKAVGAKAQNVRVSCSVEKDVRAFVKKCADVSKVASIALAASVLVASVSRAPSLVVDPIFEAGQ